MTKGANHVAAAVKDLKPSKIREMSLLAAGRNDVISLGIGEPDFPTPKEVCLSALKDAIQGATHYAPSQGDPQLIEALRGYLQRRYGMEIPREGILITSGGMGALTAVFRTILNPGEEVLVPEPHFPEYLAHVTLAGGKLVQVPTRWEEGYMVDPKQIMDRVSSKTKAILLNSPNNPTGCVLTGEILDRIADIAKAGDLLVVSDEVYDRILYDGRVHESIVTRPGMPPRTIVIGSFSKSFAMTGWRLGYAFGPPELMEQVTKVVTYYTSCASSVSQRAGLAALCLQEDPVESMVREFEKRRDLVYDALAQVPGVRVVRPGGAFYIFPNIEAITGDTEHFARALLEEEGVVVIPGQPFGPSGEVCIRIAYTVDMDTLREAMNRMVRFIRRMS